jgi:hypothetical protein
MWSRLDAFTRESWRDAARSGRIVRGSSLRGTLHVHEVDDYRALRVSLQPMFDRLARGMRRRLGDQDPTPVLEHGHELFEHGPTTVAQLKEALAERFPDAEPQALMNVVRLGLSLLIVPDDDAPDGWKVNAPFVLAREQIGDTLDSTVDDERIVTRFLASLGPGSSRDVQTWSGITGVKSTMQRMLDDGLLELVLTWQGDELFDLPGAPRPDAEASAPPRFLPMWDNLLLSHADRSRVIDPAHRPYIASKNGMPPPTYLIDGFVHGTWRIDHAQHDVKLVLSPFSEIPSRHEAALIAEGESLLRFLHPDATRHAVQVGS